MVGFTAKCHPHRPRQRCLLYQAHDGSRIFL